MEVENTCINTPAANGKVKHILPASTKPDAENHGFGIANARDTAQKYGGLLYIEQNGNRFTRDTYHRKILSCQIQWNCRIITKTVPWTGYTDIQRCEMTREMTMTAPKCRLRAIWTGCFCVAVCLCYNQAYRCPESQGRFRAIMQIWRIQEMNGQKLEKQRRNLVDRGVLSPDEKLYGSATINYTEKLVGRIETWKQGGVAIFTDRQVILTKGFSCEYIHIPYSCIKELGKCNQGFFPIGW